MSWNSLAHVMSLARAGYNIVTFDWRGFGESSEWPMNPDYMCYTEMLIDYNAVIDAVLKLDEVDTSRVGVMGWSTGGYLSWITAYQRPEVKCFVGRGVPSTFEECLPLIKKATGKQDSNVIVPKEFPTALMPGNSANRFNKPVLLIVGKYDDRTPVWMSEKIIELLPGKEKRLVVFSEAGHGGEQDPMVVDYERYMSEIKKFLDEYL